MAGTVDVGVVALRSRVLQVSRVDGDAAGSLLRCVVDGGIVLKKNEATAVSGIHSAACQTSEQFL